MPKYIKKNNIVNKDKVIARENTKLKIDFAKFAIPKNQLFIILLMSIVVSLFLIHQRLNVLSDYISISDETDIIRGVTVGVPTASPLANLFSESSASRNFFDNSTLSPYVLECHLRYPVYYFLKDTLVDWKSWSSLSYLYLLLIFVLIYSILKKEINYLIPSIAITLLLTAISYWTSASFHYVRYFPFLILGVLFSFFLCLDMFINKKLHPFLKGFLILLISAIPALFHYQGAFMLFFWFPVVLYIFTKSIASLPKGKKKMLSILISIILIICVLFLGSGYVISGLSVFNPEGFLPILGKFIDLSFPTGFWGIIISLLLLLSPILSWKLLTEFEKNLILFSFGLLVISSILSALIMGANYTDYNGANRYFTFAHTISVIFISSLLTGIYRLALAKIPFRFNAIPIFSFFLVAISLGIYRPTTLKPEIYNFSMLPQIKKSELSTFKKEISDINYAVISTHTPNAKSAFPLKKVYPLQLLKNQKFLDTLQANYILFYYVPSEEMDEELYQKLLNLGTVNQEFILVPKDSIE